MAERMQLDKTECSFVYCSLTTIASHVLTTPIHVMKSKLKSTAVVAAAVVHGSDYEQKKNE